MNTEKINTSKKVREALIEVNKFRTFDTLGTPERAELDRTAILLEKLSWEIISNDINALAEDINSTSAELKELGNKIEKSYSHLKDISITIQKTADVVGVLIEIIAKAIAAGII
jgi:hypothetical protein